MTSTPYGEALDQIFDESRVRPLSSSTSTEHWLIPWMHAPMLHAWQDAFNTFGHDFAFEKIRSQIGKGGDQLMPVFLSREEVDTHGPKVRDLFEKLIAAEVDIVLVSSAKKDELGFYRQLAGIDDLVEKETSSDDADRSKPHPDIFEAALALLPGIDKADVLVVGDTPYDAEAAGKIGLRTVGVLCGGFAEEDLRAAG